MFLKFCEKQQNRDSLISVLELFYNAEEKKVPVNGGESDFLESSLMGLECTCN